MVQKTDESKVHWGPHNEVLKTYPVFKCGDKPEKWLGLEKDAFRTQTQYVNLLCSDAFTKESLQGTQGSQTQKFVKLTL